MDHDLFAFPGWNEIRAALVVSHGVSFVTNTLRRGELERREPSEVMKDPYRRVMVMHLMIFLGAALVAFAGAGKIGL